MADIFICYFRTDAIMADRVAGQSRAQGCSVFLDMQTHVGKDWQTEVETELHQARAVIVLWSSTSRKSGDVLDEAHYARDKGKLFPALIEQVAFSIGVGGIQAADLIGWADDHEHRGWIHFMKSL